VKELWEETDWWMKGIVLFVLGLLIFVCIWVPKAVHNRNERVAECEAAGGTYVAVRYNSKSKEYACLDVKEIPFE